MKLKPCSACLLLAAGAWLTIAAPAGGAEMASSDDLLVAGLHDPPKEARPSAYWLWLNGYVNATTSSAS